MENNIAILEKVSFLLQISKSQKCSPNDLQKILLYTKEHSDNAIIGKIFGYSVSDYAIATLKWINSSETEKEFNQIFKTLPKSRKAEITELIARKLYNQL